MLPQTISLSLQGQLCQLQSLLGQTNNTSYINPIAMLGNATIGQHVRHILELIQCLMTGYATGTVDYDARKRDANLETDTTFACHTIEGLCQAIVREDKPLLLASQSNEAPVKTCYFRELVYNCEHAIHHMAMIRVALRELGLDLVDETFGVAAATIQYKQQICVQ